MNPRSVVQKKPEKASYDEAQSGMKVGEIIPKITAVDETHDGDSPKGKAIETARGCGPKTDRGQSD